MQINIKTYPNGLTLIYQQVKDISSAAYNLNFGSGVVADSESRVGASLILSELTGRQAAQYSPQELSDLFDGNGISHGESAKLERFQFQGSCLSSKLAEALRLLYLLFSEPVIGEEGLPKVKELLLQEILSVQDEPSKLVGREFNQRYFPSPYNRSLMGELAGITATTVTDLEQVYQDQYHVSGAILSIVANLDFTEIENAVAPFLKCKGTTTPEDEIPWNDFPAQFQDHLDFDSAQTQILLAYPAPAISSPDYYPMRLVNGLLSGGMFGRLFLEVREKRGLCYSVYSSYTAHPKYGRLICYSGTTTERARATLDVIQEVLVSLLNTITEEELKRVKTDILSSLVISRESSLSKAISYANDYENFGRVRSLDEIKTNISEIGINHLNQYLARSPFQNPSILTLGKVKIQ